MAKFLTRVALNADPNVECTFEAESAQEVRGILTRLLAPLTEQEQAMVAAVDEAAQQKPAKRRGRPPKSGVVGVITPAGAARVVEAAQAEKNEAEAQTKVPVATGPVPTLAELSDAIRAYARQPGVGVPGVTKLIGEFKTDAGDPAQQVKAIAVSEYPTLAAKLKTLLVVS